MQAEAYVLPLFLEEANKAITENAKAGLVNAWANKLYDPAESIYDMKADIPKDQITNITSEVMDLSQEVNSILEVFKKPIKKLPTNISFSWYNNDVRELYPFILLEYIKRIQHCAELIFTIEQDKFPDLLDEISEADYVRKLHQRICIFNRNSYMSANDMLNYPAEEITQVTDAVRTNKFIPFLLYMKNERLNDKIELNQSNAMHVSFKELAESTTKLVRMGNDKLFVLHDSAKNSAGDDLPMRARVDRFFYSAKSVYLGLVKYLYAAIIRMETMAISNIHSLMEVASMAGWNVGTPDMITESDESDTRTILDPNQLLSVAEQLRTNLFNIGIDAKPRPVNLTPDNVDEEAYRMPLNAIRTIKERFKNLLTTVTVDPDYPINQALEDTQLIWDDVEELLKVDRIKNLNFLKTFDFSEDVLRGEIDTFLDVVPEISHEANSLINFLGEAKKGISANVNHKFTNNDLQDMILKYIDTLIPKIIDYAEELAEAYEDRLRGIGEAVCPDDPQLRSISLESDRYFSNALCTTYQIMEEDFYDELEAINKIYTEAWICKMAGIPFYEDDNPASNATNNDKPATNGTNTGANNTDGDKKNSTAPKVTDNQPQNNQNNTDPNQGNKPGDKVNVKEKAGTKAHLIRQFIDRVVDNIRDWINKGGKEKNEKFIENNREYLNTRNYANVSVDVLPYLTTMNYCEFADKAINRALQIDQATLNSAEEEQLKNMVFSTINLPKDEKSIDAQVIHAMKVGSKPLTTVKLTDSQIKAEIPKMEQFCESYYGHFMDDLMKLKARADELEKLEAKVTSGNRSRQNVDLIGTYVNALIHGARTASRDRANDYIKILSSLAKGNPAAKNKKPEEAPASEGGENNTGEAQGTADAQPT